MSPLILTKISKFMLIGSVSAYLSFASQYNPSLRIAFYYLLIGIILSVLVVLLWEGRERIADDVDGIEQMISGISNNSSKRQYYLNNNIRIELVIGVVVIVVCSLIGAI